MNLFEVHSYWIERYAILQFKLFTLEFDLDRTMEKFTEEPPCNQSILTTTSCTKSILRQWHQPSKFFQTLQIKWHPHNSGDYQPSQISTNVSDSPQLMLPFLGLWTKSLEKNPSVSVYRIVYLTKSRCQGPQFTCLFHFKFVQKFPPSQQVFFWLPSIHHPWRLGGLQQFLTTLLGPFPSFHRARQCPGKM